MRASDERRAALAAAGTGIQVGAAMVATRFAVDQAGATELALLRYVIGFVFLLVALVLTRPRWRIAALLGREALTTNKIAGVGLTVIGVVLAFGTS